MSHSFTHVSRAYISLFWSIWEHPQNARRGRARALSELMKWQATKRIVKLPVVAPVFDGAKIIFYPDSHVAGNFLYYNGFRDVDEEAFCTTYLRPGDTVIDVGANEGVYSLLAAQLVGAKGRVLAIEPLPINVERLRANLRLNSMNQVEVLPVAASDSAGEVEFTLNRAQGGSAEHIKLDIDAELLSFRVETVALDDLDVADGAALVKVDVEGVEPLVLKGAATLIKDHRCPVFQLEFVDRFMKRYSLSANDTAGWLTDQGYALCTYSSTERVLHVGGPALVGTATNLFAVSERRMDEVADRLSCTIQRS